MTSMKKLCGALCRIGSHRLLAGIGILIVAISLPLIVASLLNIPDFADTRTWKQTGVIVDYQDSVPYGVTRSYALRFFPIIEGASYAPIWDEHELIYKAWGPFTFTPLAEWCHFQTFLSRDGWAPPMRSNKSEAIPRIDWAGKVALGFTLLMYPSNDARQASAFGVFRNPFLEILDAAPSVPVRF